MRALSIIAAAAGLIAVGSRVTAQPLPAAAPSGGEAPPSVADGALDEPTLAINAHVEARSITVRERGNAQARIWADPGGEGQWRFERQRVPNPIPVGRTFNNVAFDLNARATVDENGVRLEGAASPSAPSAAAVPPPP